jgi:hypothetical protein
MKKECKIKEPPAIKAHLTTWRASVPYTFQYKGREVGDRLCEQPE